ncbi:hypothetical protein G4B88_016741 [Cannabis sativa]|uniref:RNase H type-1 domain-containing protein n=1 Tax=Cannabis sativa TaxID=3483 RepID=A0A7J6FAY9_CANSA|nr:hypothetical protein G4B88_016741 [Cannabis sativa]
MLYGDVFKFFTFGKRWVFFNFLPPKVNRPADILWWCWDHFEKDKLLRFIGFSWLIWLRRNNFIFNKKHPPDRVWIDWALEYLDQQLVLQQQQPLLLPSKPIATWSPTPSDVLQINTDAALNLGVLGYGLSAVIRDNTGRMVVAEVTYIPGCLSVQLAEAAAIKLGIQLASRWSIQKARLGSDCQTIVKAINSNLRVHTDWGQVVMDINHLKTLFQDLSSVFLS